MENGAVSVQIERNSVADLEVLPTNQELPQPHGIPATDADLTSQVWHLVKKYAKLAGIGDVSPHDLRRTAIT